MSDLPPYHPPPAYVQPYTCSYPGACAPYDPRTGRGLPPIIRFLWSQWPQAYAYAPPPPPPPPPPAADPAPNADIAFVQHALNALSGAGLIEDGIGGPATRAALMAYLQTQLHAAGDQP